MNHQYKVIFNRSLGLWQAVSELTKSRGKSSTRKVVAAVVGAGAMLLGAVPASAQTVTIKPEWNTGNYTTNTFTLSDGSTADYVGPYHIDGILPTRYGMSYLDLQAAGYLHTPLPANFADMVFYTDAGHILGITVPNPDIPGSTISFNVLDSTTFAANPLIGRGVTIFVSAADANIFSNLRLATAENGSTINVKAVPDFNQIGVKDTALFLAQGAGSTINLQQSMALALNSESAALADATNPKSLEERYTVFTGSFVAFDGSTQTVNNVDDLKAYNEFLIAALKTGDLKPADYNAAFSKGFTEQTFTTSYDPTLGKPIPPDDPLFTPVVRQVLAQADGVGAIATIAPGVTIRFGSYSGPESGPFAALYASNGGEVINNGLIDSRFVAGAGIQVAANSSGVNKGVLWDAVAWVDGVGSQFSNEGIINTFNGGQGIILIDDATAVNHGAINVGVNDSPLNALGAKGVDLLGRNSTFINAADGVIYIGREEGFDISVAGGPINWGGADTVHSGGDVLGVRILDTSSAVNQGRIIINSGTMNALAMAAGRNSSVTNDTTGVITINGGLAGAGVFGLNRGLYAGADSTATNLGLITLNGINTNGMHLVDGAQGFSSGVIDINGGFDGANTLLRNFGINAEGGGSHAELSGVVNLRGDGAIGVYAHQGAKIDVTLDGEVVTFSGASKQIGYYASGVGSSVLNVADAPQDLNSEDSVFYRVDNGAIFENAALSPAGATLNINGDKSIAIVASGTSGPNGTGVVSSANISAGATVNLNGAGASAALVEGGAQARFGTGVTVNLNGFQSFGGIADGQGHNFAGELAGTPVVGDFVVGSTAAAGSSGFGTGTILVSDVSMTSATDGVVGYFARNGAYLANTGTLTFTGEHARGVELRGFMDGVDASGVPLTQGTTVLNSGSISVGTMDPGTPVGSGANSGGWALWGECFCQHNNQIINTGLLTVRGGSDGIDAAYGDPLHNPEHFDPYGTARTYGIYVSGAVTADMQAGGLILEGQGAVGAAAFNRGTLNLGAINSSFSSDPNISNQIMLLLDGPGTSFTAVGSQTGRLNASGVGSTLVRLQNGATASQPVAISANGQDSQAIWVTGINEVDTMPAFAHTPGTQGAQWMVDHPLTYTPSNATATAGFINVGGYVDLDPASPTYTETLKGGDNAKGIRVEYGATATLGSDLTVRLIGDHAVAGLVDGRETRLDGTQGTEERDPDSDHPTVLTNQALIKANANNAVAFRAQYGGKIVNQGVIDLNSGTGNVGIELLQGGHLDNQADITVADGIGVLLDGGLSTLSNTATIYVNDGTAGIVVQHGASLTHSGGIGNITVDGTASGIILAKAGTHYDEDGIHTEAGIPGALSAHIDDSVITVKGTGHGIDNLAEISDVHLNNTVITVGDGAGIRTATPFVNALTSAPSNPTITVTGKGYGVLFQNADGTTSASALDFTGAPDETRYDITVTGAGGTGVLADATGIVAATEHITIDVQHAAGGSALKFGDQVTTGSNDGTLTSISAVAPTVDANVATTFTNTGSISNTSANPLAVKMDADSATMNNTGLITGNVDMNGNDATVNVGDAGTSKAGTVTGTIALKGPSTASVNTVLITAGSDVNTVAGSKGTDTVTIQGQGSRFTTLAGDANAVKNTAVFDDSDYTITTANTIQNYDQVNLINDSTVTLKANLGGRPAGGASVDIETGSTLSMQPAAAQTIVVANLVTGTGTLAQDGAGLTRFTSNSNAFAGTTEVNTGTLRVEGTLGSAAHAMTVADGATVGGNGTIGGDVTVEDGGILAPNAGNTTPAVVSTLTIGGDLTLDNDAILNFRFGEANANNAKNFQDDPLNGQPTGGGGSLNDLVNVGGDLVLAGTLNVTVTPGGRFDTGVYRIFNYAGDLTDNTLALGTMPPDSTQVVQTSVKRQVNLVVNSTATVPMNFWDGGDTTLHGDDDVSGGDGTWQDGSGNTNWTDETGTPIGVWDDGAFAVFMGAPGTVTVDNSLGDVTASGMQFAVDGYVITGEDLTLVADANGETVISVGDMHADSAQGKATTATITTNLVGDTNLVKDDLGTLILKGENTYTGTTGVYEGTLRVDGSIADGAVTVDTGAALGGSGTIGDALTKGGDVTVDAGGTLAPSAGGSDPASTLTINGNLSLDNDSKLAYNFGDGTVAGPTQPGGGPLNDLTNVAGDLILGGTIDVAQTQGGSFDPGIYRVFNYDGDLTNNTLSIGSYTGNPGANLKNFYVQTSIDGQVNLILKHDPDAQDPEPGPCVSSNPADCNGRPDTDDDGDLKPNDNSPDGRDVANRFNYWDGPVVNNGANRNDGVVGGGTGIWEAGTIANDNWTRSSGDINANFDNGAFAHFGGQAGTVTVDNHAGDVTGHYEAVKFGGAEFTTDGYVITGEELALATKSNGDAITAQIHVVPGATATFENVITGAGGIDKTGKGTLLLNGQNTYTGDTTVSVGTLGGNGSVAGNVVITDKGTLAPGGVTTATAVDKFTLGGDLTFADNASTLAMDLKTPFLHETGGVGVEVYDASTANYATSRGNDLVQVDKNVVLDGQLDITTPTTLDEGKYRLINYDGTLTNNGLDIASVNGVTANDIDTPLNTANFYVQTTIGGQVNLIVKHNPFDPTPDPTDPGECSGAPENCNGRPDTDDDGHPDPSTPDGNDIANRFNYWDMVQTNPALRDNDAVDGGTGTWEAGAQANDNWVQQTGAINANVDNGSFVHFQGEAGTVTVNNHAGEAGYEAVKFAGAEFKTDGYVITGQDLAIANKSDNTAIIAQIHVLPDVTATFANKLTGDGGIDKTGKGTLVFTGANTYTGGTEVEVGTLRVDGSLADGEVTVADGATIGGNGVIGNATTKQGNVTVEAGGTLAPNAAGTNATSTLTINGTLSLDEDALLEYNFGKPNVVGGAYNDLTIVNGDLSLGGTINVTETTTGKFDPGVYRVISYSGDWTNKGSGTLALGSTPGSDDYMVQTSVDHQVNLVLNIEPGAYVFWDGEAGPHSDGTINGGDGVWQNGQHADSNSNWTDVTGDPEGPWDEGQFAIFQAEPGTVTVDNSLGDVTANGMQFAADGYVITGDDLTLLKDGNEQSLILVGDHGSDGKDYVATIDANLKGDTTLVKGDYGTLLLNGENTYGDTVIRDGTLGGKGSVSGDVNVSPEGTLSPGGVKAGTESDQFTIGGSLTFESDTSKLAFDLNTPNIPTDTTKPLYAVDTDGSGYDRTKGNDLVQVADNLVLDGQLDINTDTTLEEGKYRLINYGGELTNNLLDIASVNGDDSINTDNFYVQTTIGGQVNLIVKHNPFDPTPDPNDPNDPTDPNGCTGAPENCNGRPDTDDNGHPDPSTPDGNDIAKRFNYWDMVQNNASLRDNNAVDGGTGVWEAGAQANDNWVQQTGAVNANVDNGSFVHFQGEAGTVTVNNHAGEAGYEAIKFAGAEFKTDGYVITGEDLKIANKSDDSAITAQIHVLPNVTATFQNKITGDGGIDKTGNGTLVFSGVNSYTGETQVSVGTLRAGAVDVIRQSAAVSVATNATLDLANFNQTVNALSNAGTVRFGNPVAQGATFTPTTLVVTGDYTGNGGTLAMRTQLGNDASPTDKLVVGGDVTGKTHIQLTNANGLGALTTGNGIELVNVGGASATGAFTLNVNGNEYIDAGAFRYRLFNGPTTGADDNWYLRSQSTNPPDPGPGPGPSPDPDPRKPDLDPEYRPEVPWLDALPGVLRQGDLDLLGNLHQRVGDDLRGTENDHRLWARTFGSDAFKLRQDNVTSPEAQGGTFGFQGGIDLYQSRNAENRRNDVGIMAGKVKTAVDVSGMTGATADPQKVGRLRPETASIGAYWTFKSAGGFYLDLVGQKLWYGGDGYSVDGNGKPNIKADVKGDGYLGSLEVGQQMKVSSRWLLEPQAQVIFHGMNLKDISLPGATASTTATTVSYGKTDSTVGRLGIRLAGEYGIGGNHPWTPYLRANWWHGFDGNYQTSFSTPVASTTISTKTGYDTGEIGAGFTVALNENVSLYSEVDHRFAMGSSASANSRGLAGSIGVRIGFGRTQAPAQPAAVLPPPPPVVAEPPPAPTPPPPPPPAPVRITLSADALFDFDSAELRAVGRNSLDNLVRDLGRVQYDLMLISGHTDRLGSESYNQRLSDRRANAVRDYLIGRGVPASNIRATGYGKSQPVTTPEQCTGPRNDALIACLQPDRRVDVQINGLRQP